MGAMICEDLGENRAEAWRAYSLGSGETRWNRQKIWAEPDLVAFHI